MATVDIPHRAANLVQELYGSLAEADRLVYPTSSEEHSVLIDRITLHHDQGGHVAIADGAFDVPHAGHAWCLRACRLEAARRHFGAKFENVDNLSRKQLVASFATLLIVTVDADYKVAHKKGFIPEKGNISRPVYPWEARANTVAGYMIPDGVGNYRPVADIVTVEGDPNHVGTPLESYLHFGETLQHLGILDTWLVSGDHPETAQIATEIAGSKVVRVISQESMKTINPKTGEKWSSSYIIKSIKEG